MLRGAVARAGARTADGEFVGPALWRLAEAGADEAEGQALRPPVPSASTSITQAGRASRDRQGVARCGAHSLGVLTLALRRLPGSWCPPDRSPLRHCCSSWQGSPEHSLRPVTPPLSWLRPASTTSENREERLATAQNRLLHHQNSQESARTHVPRRPCRPGGARAGSVRKGPSPASGRRCADPAVLGAPRDRA